jgi:hypothetical protein
VESFVIGFAIIEIPSVVISKKRRREYIFSETLNGA